MDAMKEHFVDCRGLDVHVVDRAGHMVHHEQPDRLAAAILGFLNCLPG